MPCLEASPIAPSSSSAYTARIRLTYHDPSSAYVPAPSSSLQIDNELASRKLALLRRTGLFSDQTMGATIERACTTQDLCDAYRLVHQTYLETGYIKPASSGMRLRIFEASSETATFIAKHKGSVVGVISLVGDSLDLGLPSDSAFADELNALRSTGIKLCEVTNQAVAPGYRKSAITTELMRCAFAHAMHVGYRVGVAAVSPSHNAFYDLLGFGEIGSERSYSSKLHDPVVAVALDLDEYIQIPDGLAPAEEFVRVFLGRDNPYLQHVAAWDRRARAGFFNPELLAGIFVEQSNFLAECTPAELDVVRLRWGQELFRAVAGSMTAPHSDSWIESIEESVSEIRTQRALGSGPAPGRAPGAAYTRDTSPKFAELDFRFGFEERWTGVGAQAPVRTVAAWWGWIRAVLAQPDYRNLAMGN